MNKNKRIFLAVFLVTSVITTGIIFGGSVFANSQPPSGQIWKDSLVEKIGNQCLYTSRVGWSTQNVDQAKVTVRDPDTNQEKVFAMHNN
ncbi:MAG: hypothetical protein WD898_00615, partial [Candidatus Paceibacterota bacterium]